MKQSTLGINEMTSLLQRIAGADCFGGAGW
jgi:hypothetical protein